MGGSGEMEIYENASHGSNGSIPSRISSNRQVFQSRAGTASAKPQNRYLLKSPSNQRCLLSRSPQTATQQMMTLQHSNRGDPSLPSRFTPNSPIPERTSAQILHDNRKTLTSSIVPREESEVKKRGLYEIMIQKQRKLNSDKMERLNLDSHSTIKKQKQRFEELSAAKASRFGQVS